MDLDDPDLRRVLDATTMLVTEPVPSIESVLVLLRDLVPCVSVSFNDMTLAAGDYRYVIVPSDQQELAARLKPVYDRLAGEHPLVRAAQPRQIRGALRFCDVPDGDRITETPLYREFYLPFGVRYQLVIQLPSPPDVVVGYALNRSADQGEFSDRDVAVLNSLEAHLAMHHRQVVDAERNTAMAHEVVREGGWTALTVRADGVVDASTSAVVVAALTESGVVPDAIARLLPTYDDGSYESSIHDLTIGGRRWRCAVHPVLVGPAVVLVQPLDDGAGPVASLVALGLTSRQVEVALALARTGATNSQLARSLGISEATVKKHLENIYPLLRVDSRAAAVAALTGLAR